MVHSTKPSLLRRLGALVAAAAMLVVLPAGVSTASAASDDADMLTVTMTRTDTLGDEVYVGDTLTYSFTNTNNTSSAFTAFPAESNLSGVLTTGTPNCRYENLAGGASYPCSTASHTITADDLTAGSFTPRTVWKATSDRGGTQVLQDNIVSTGDTVTVKEGKRPDPATIPTDRADGEAVRLATARQNLGTECYRIPALAERPTAGSSPHSTSVPIRRWPTAAASSAGMPRSRTPSCSASPRMAASRGRRSNMSRRARTPRNATAIPTHPMWSIRRPARSSCSSFTRITRLRRLSAWRR